MTARPIDLGFSIADAQDVALAYDGDNLRLEFVDWRARRLRVRFSDVPGFRWQRADEAVAGAAYDGANELSDSAWLDEHRRQHEAGADHRHLVLNFNAAGRLDVLCVEVSGPEVLEADAAG